MTTKNSYSNKKKLNTIVITLLLLGTLFITLSPRSPAAMEEIMVSDTHDLICGQQIWHIYSNNHR